MKRLIGLAGLFGVHPALLAHESWAPHTHTLGNGHSDLFILCVAGLLTLVTALLFWRMTVRRRLKSSRVVSRRS